MAGRYHGRLPTWHHRLREQGHNVTAVGKLHYRSSDDDNRFTEEIIPMHLHEGKGAIKNLLRGYGTEPPKDGARHHLTSRATCEITCSCAYRVFISPPEPQGRCLPEPSASFL